MTVLTFHLLPRSLKNGSSSFRSLFLRSFQHKQRTARKSVTRNMNSFASILSIKTYKQNLRDIFYIYFQPLKTFLQTHSVQFPGRTKLKAESSKVLESGVFIISKPNQVDPNHSFPNFYQSFTKLWNTFYLPVSKLWYNANFEMDG